MRLLLLGGTGDGRRLAAALHADGHDVVYSVADPSAHTHVPCAVRRGGFGGAAGLTRYIRAQSIERLVDATHPYAATISANARTAATEAGIALWALHRPSWRPEPGDRWHYLPDTSALRAALEPYRRPLFTIGPGPLDQAPVPAHQHWSVRCLPGHGRTVPARCTVLEARGPFALDDERRLLDRLGTDVIVTKDSGGDAVTAKLVAARERRIPVLVLRRPPLPRPDRDFSSAAALRSALRAEKGSRE